MFSLEINIQNMSLQLKINHIILERIKYIRIGETGIALNSVHELVFDFTRNLSRKWQSTIRFLHFTKFRMAAQAAQHKQNKLFLLPLTHNNAYHFTST